jgi:DNA-binding transcriptional ArsR family regulator
MTSRHGHPIDASGVELARQHALPLPEAELLGQLLDLLSDPVRLRILFALLSAHELCVGDLALAVEVTADQSTYALKLLRAAGVVQSRREGRVIHYRLADEFPHQLLDHCLRQLLTLTKETRS